MGGLQQPQLQWCEQFDIVNRRRLDRSAGERLLLCGALLFLLFSSMGSLALFCHESMHMHTQSWSTSDSLQAYSFFIRTA